MPGFVRWAIHRCPRYFGQRDAPAAGHSIRCSRRTTSSSEDRAEERAHIIALREGHLGDESAAASAGAAPPRRPLPRVRD